MIRVLEWLAAKMGTRVALVLMLLAVTLGSVVIGLQRMVRGLDSGLVLFMVIIGLGIGALLARSPLPSWLAGILALYLGIVTVFLRVGQLAGKLIAVMLALFQCALQFLVMPRQVPDAEPVVRALTQLWDAIVTLVVRWRDWQSAMASGAPAYDPVAVALAWGFMLWLIAAWAGWVALRHSQPLPAVLPALGLLATMLVYTNSNPLILLPPVAAMLLMMVLLALATRERDWETRGVDTAEDLRGDLAMVALPLVILLTVFAALVPSWSARDLIEWTHRRVELPTGDMARLPDSFGIIPPPAPTTIFDAVRAPGLPRQHLLGAGQELAKNVVMTVQTDDPKPSRHYWRTSTYDVYTGRGWLTSETQTKDYRAGEPALGDLPSHRPLYQKIDAVQDLGGLLIASGVLANADRDYQIAWRSSPDMDAFSASIKSQSYQVESLVPAVDEMDLRSAGSDYPAPVRERYLRLDDDVPERVLALARDLTATARTPYDRARAIESYLRQIPYTLEVPAPPSGRDVVDYFLFDLKRGYCDYDASAMVVLSRAAGLPARLVVGYAPGSYDEVNERTIVTEADAHSWVDIYFPSYGWIEFEPTGGRAPVDYAGASPFPEPKGKPGEHPFVSVKSDRVDWLPLLLSSLAAVALGGVLIITVSDLRLRRLSPQQAIAQVYGRMARLARRLGVPLNAAHTPSETSELVSKYLAPFARGHLKQAFQRATADVSALSVLYIQSSYSPRPPQAADRARAIQLWNDLRYRLLLAYLLQRIQRAK